MTTATIFVVLLVLSGVTADPGMFAQVIRRAARRSALGYQGSPFLSALNKARTGEGRVVGLRTACLAAPRPTGDKVGNGESGDSSQRLGREIAQALQSKGKETRLVLHFDLNKTLIMVDPAGRKTQSQVLNSVLAEICWGHVERAAGAEQAPSWKWDGCPPSPEPPWSRTSSPSTEKQSGVTSPEKHGHTHDCAASAVPMSYSDFLHQEFGDAEGKDNRRMKDIRDEKKGSFTENGHPGADIRATYLLLEQALSLPEAVAGSPLAEGAGLAGRKSYYLLPSFLSCLLALKEAEVDFGVVFRTFGDDIVGVSREYNAFCEGDHPLFPGVKMDGSDGRGDYRVLLSSRSNSVGAFYRDEEGVALVLGTLSNPTDREQLRSMEEAGHDVYRSSGDIHRAICARVLDFPPPLPHPPSADGSAATVAAAAILPPRSGSGNPANGNEQAGRGGGSGRRGRCLALRDFYPFWREKLEDATAGKVLPVELSQNPEVWPIMFDDNIGRPDSDCGAHIVDVRDVATGRSVPFDAALRRHIVRAEPLLTIGPGAAVAAAATAAASGHSFFLLEVLKRLSQERAASFVKSENDTGRISSAPQP